MSSFSKILEKSSEFVSLSESIDTLNAPVGAIGVPDINKVHLIHSLCEKLNKNAFIITPDDASAVRMYENLSVFQNDVLLYPSREFTFNNVESVSHEYEQLRIGVLSRIIDKKYSAIVMPVSAAIQFTMPSDELKKHSFTINTDDEINIDETVNALIKAGYSRFDQVEGTSQFSVRGGLIDIFPPSEDEPVRIELWGDTVESIAKFDLVSQRRGELVDSISIIPSREVLFESKEKQAKLIDEVAENLKGKAIKAREKLYDDSQKLKNGVNLHCNDKYMSLAYESKGIFDYICDDLLFVCESAKSKEKCETYNKVMNEEIKWLLEDGGLCKGLDKFNLDFTQLIQMYEKYNAIYIDSMPRGSFDTPIRHLASFNCQTFNVWSGTLSQLKDELFPLIKANYAVVIMAGTSRAGKALAYDISEMGYNSIYCEQQPSEFVNGNVTILKGTLTSGFQLMDCKLAVFTHAKANQSKKKYTRKYAKDSIHSLDELTVGDYIVHNVHGIGIFDGIHALDFQGVKKDYIKISYAKGDTLYVPVTQLDLVSKYIGPRDDTKVKINKLGSGDWKKTKNKVRASVQDMAKELIKLYAKRMGTKGYAFSEDTDLQRDFELRFPYDETQDQLRCSDEIKGDMEKSVPMDRLLCGDVGFGKTEVALRACFKCISEGKQCAILVPTTVLAMQHYQTAKKRLEPFPVRVEMLSRFVKPARQKEILNDLKDGKVDFIVGTHRIISKDIKFNDLGLLVVDEEQRFGVAQKEKIKEKFPKVDVLTLSATPIPRTLNMAMSGIRDMSLLEQAPGERRPVQTYVVEHDFDMLVEAMEKELARGGQCYYLHNNVETIEHTAMKIKKAMPDANIGVAHGKMTEEQISDVWENLINGNIDVLVCTTIIETGVDVPNVNTLIIENADRMGLAQLHQIRGRVGRSSRRGYAYFTFVRGKELSEIATKRLEAIREYTEFGSGFKIAMRDLEIRGAGSLLGTRQHGHMEAVGYDMYIKLLEEAVNQEKGLDVEPTDDVECLIDLPVDANIPKDYIESTPQRLAMYKSIANIRSQQDANDVYDELTDRFGNPPAPVYGLVEIALMRNTAMQLGITEVKQVNSNVRFMVNDINMKYLVVLNEKMPNRVTVKAGKTPCISVKIMEENAIDTIRIVFNLLENV